ncbi:zinc-binding dehydrogenase [Novosphingobium terrae]|uniref:zinc-binding dehydrogenase n=1 Tax=Novosphingobium terrae TaxID=2726189 RepID=UPI00197E38F9|nr:zinc-binding dehydrogenase [Novosphingobium terrae]
MLSVLYRQHGKPSQVLEAAQVADPVPPAHGEVLIRVQARPVHYGDLLGIAGHYRSNGDLTVPEGGNRVGFEGFGVVEAVGEGVALTPGTRVAFFPGRAAWSELAIVSAAYVTPIPDSIADDVAAQLHVNPLTAALLWRAVQQAGAIPGQHTVVLTAAGSAVSRLTISLLRDAGLDVVALVRSAKGAEELASLIPGLSVFSTDSPDWQTRLAAAVADKPVQAVLDAVGGSLASDLVKVLTNGGSLISYGDLSGEPIAVRALAFSTRNIRIFGVTVGTWGGLPPEQRAEDIALALRLAEGNPALFPVAARYPLTSVREAADHVERPGKAGVVLLTSY